MIEIDGDLKCRSSCLVGPAGISGPQLDEGQPYEANSLRVLGVQRQVLVSMGYVIGFDSATEIVAGSGQITPPERAHAKEISALCPGDRVMTRIIEEGPGEFIAIVGPSGRDQQIDREGPTDDGRHLGEAPSAVSQLAQSSAQHRPHRWCEHCLTSVRGEPGSERFDDKERIAFGLAPESCRQFRINRVFTA